MLRKKWMAVCLMMALTVSLFTGCDAGNKKTLEDATKIVQVTKIDGTTITTETGEFKP